MSWRPVPLVAASIAWHAAILGALLADPAVWPEAAFAVLANHAVLGVAMLWPTRSFVGRTLRRLPEPASGCVALTFDDGPDPVVTPRVLELLERHGARATFFCIGERAAAHPALVREALRRGHAVGNHTMRHRAWFALLGYGAQRREIAAAQAVLQALGPTPRLFRAPFGLRSPLLDPALHGLALSHVAWSRRSLDTRSTEVERVFDRLTRGLQDGEILLLHDGNSAVAADGTPVVVLVLERLLPWLAARGYRCEPIGGAARSTPLTAPDPRGGPLPAPEPAAGPS